MAALKIENFPVHYRALVLDLDRIFSSKLWLTGGWLLADKLGRKYYGDVDLICEMRSEEISFLLEKFKIPTVTLPTGSARLKLFDGNHIDVSSVRSFEQGETVFDSISNFLFSATSHAVSVRDQRWLSTEAALRDIQEKQFRLNHNVVVPKNRLMNAVRDAATLESYYGLLAVDRKSWLMEADVPDFSIVNGWNQERTFSYLKAQVADYLPSGCDAFLTRGIVRAAILNELSIWDDFDVFVPMSNAELISWCKEAGINFVENFFGSPKVFLDNGNTMDLIPVRNRGSLPSALEKFAHSCDAICWSIKDEILFDPCQSLPSLMSRELHMPVSNIEGYSSHDLGYYAMKAAYLTVRHELRPSVLVRHLMNVPQAFSYHHTKNACSLARELHSIVGRDEAFERLLSLFEGHSSSALGILISFWEDRVRV